MWREIYIFTSVFLIVETILGPTHGQNRYFVNIMILNYNNNNDFE